MKFRKFIRPSYNNARGITPTKPDVAQSGFIENSVRESITSSVFFKSNQFVKPKEEARPSKGDVMNYDVNKGFESLGIGESVKIGKATVKITGNYGLRNLKGRSQEHSRGMDITTSTGKAHALRDGIIENIKLQGNGSVITPSEGKAAGYYVTMLNSDGSRTQYMHLDPMTETDIKNLKGKRLKRGDEIWGYTTGSGSMTGPHIKVRVFGDSSKYNIDPSQQIKGESYTFIPNKNGDNILKLKNGGRILLK